MNRMTTEKPPKEHVFINATNKKQFSAQVANWRITVQPRLWQPPTDLIETESSFIVQVEIAGMQEKDFIVGYNKNLLVISGTRCEKYTDCVFHQMEIQNGEFFTSLRIPAPINKNAISAVYENGFLQITLPKSKTHKINISV